MISIPALDDFDAPPSSAELAPRSRRDAINAAVRMREPKPTVAAWLNELAGTLALCSDRAEVEAAILSDEVCRAGRTLKGAARQALRDVLDAALSRHDALRTGPICAGP